MRGWKFLRQTVSREEHVSELLKLIRQAGLGVTALDESAQERVLYSWLYSFEKCG